MASSTTPNLELPLIQPTDHPTWQGDFNNAMNTLDETIQKINDDITKLNPDIDVNGLQEKLVAGVNIQTINGESILQSGNLSLQPTLVSGTTLRTINGQSLLGSGDIEIAGGDDTSNLQPLLVSGENIKTINSTSLLGSGDIAVQTPLVSGTSIKTINNQNILGSGNIDISGGDTSGLQPLLVSGQNIKTINDQSLLGSGNINISATAITQIDQFFMATNVTILDDGGTTQIGAVSFASLDPLLSKKVDITLSITPTFTNSSNPIILEFASSTTIYKEVIPIFPSTNNVEQAISLPHYTSSSSLSLSAKILSGSGSVVIKNVWAKVELYNGVAHTSY